MMSKTIEFKVHTPFLDYQSDPHHVTHLGGHDYKIEVPDSPDGNEQAVQFLLELHHNHGVDSRTSKSLDNLVDNLKQIRLKNCTRQYLNAVCKAFGIEPRGRKERWQAEQIEAALESRKREAGGEVHVPSIPESIVAPTKVETSSPTQRRFGQMQSNIALNSPNRDGRECCSPDAPKMEFHGETTQHSYSVPRGTADLTGVVAPPDNTFAPTSVMVGTHLGEIATQETGTTLQLGLEQDPQLEVIQRILAVERAKDDVILVQSDENERLKTELEECQEDKARRSASFDKARKELQNKLDQKSTFEEKYNQLHSQYFKLSHQFELEKGKVFNQEQLQKAYDRLRDISANAAKSYQEDVAKTLNRNQYLETQLKTGQAEFAAIGLELDKIRDPARPGTLPLQPALTDIQTLVRALGAELQKNRDLVSRSKREIEELKARVTNVENQNQSLNRSSANLTSERDRLCNEKEETRKKLIESQQQMTLLLRNHEETRRRMESVGQENDKARAQQKKMKADADEALVEASLQMEASHAKQLILIKNDHTRDIGDRERRHRKELEELKQAVTDEWQLTSEQLQTQHSKELERLTNIYDSHALNQDEKTKAMEETIDTLRNTICLKTQEIKHLERQLPTTGVGVLRRPPTPIARTPDEEGSFLEPVVPSECEGNESGYTCDIDLEQDLGRIMTLYTHSNDWEHAAARSPSLIHRTIDTGPTSRFMTLGTQYQDLTMQDFYSLFQMIGDSGSRRMLTPPVGEV